MAAPSACHSRARSTPAPPRCAVAGGSAAARSFSRLCRGARPRLAAGAALMRSRRRCIGRSIELVEATCDVGGQHTAGQPRFRRCLCAKRTICGAVPTAAAPRRPYGRLPHKCCRRPARGHTVVSRPKRRRIGCLARPCNVVRSVQTIFSVATSRCARFCACTRSSGTAVASQSLALSNGPI